MAKSGGPSLITLALLGGAGYVAYQFFSTSTAAASATPTTPTPAAPAMPSTGQLATLFSQVQAAAVTDAQSGDPNNKLVNGAPNATWSAWNNLLTRVAPSLTGLPDYGSLANQPDLNLPMSASQYWSLMGPWLTKNKGLSGAMAGLGALYRLGAR